TGQTVDGAIKRKEDVSARMAARQAGLFHVGGEFESVGEIAFGKKIREAVDDVVGDVERLADFARGTATAIGNDVGGHGRAVFAVTTINFLDDALASLATGKIDVDVGPAFAAFAEEALEKQIGADGIDGRDAET